MDLLKIILEFPDEHAPDAKEISLKIRRDSPLGIFFRDFYDVYEIVLF